MNRTRYPRTLTWPTLRDERRLLGSFLALALLCLGLLSTGLAHASSDLWPEVPLPPRAKVEWVGDSVRVNGVPMRIMHFASRAGRAEVVDYYRSYWSGGYRLKPHVSVLDDATLVSQIHGPYLMTVKVRDAANGASEGQLAVSRVLGSKIERSPGELPLMPGAKVVQVVESNDPGKRSRQVLISNPSAAASVVEFYRSALTDAGWRATQDNETRPERAGPKGFILVFMREHSELELSVVAAPDGRGSGLVATLVTKDTVPSEF